MESPQAKLDAAIGRGHALLGTALDDSDWLDEESRFTFGDLRTLLNASTTVFLGHEIPHNGSNVR